MSVSAQSVSRHRPQRHAALPAAPTNLTAAIASCGPQVNLSWTDNATNENGFVIERSADGGVHLRPDRHGPGHAITPAT